MTENREQQKGGGSPLSDSERQAISRERRAKAYMIIKALAQRTGYMAGPYDMAGLDRFLEEFAVEGHEIDWFTAVTQLQEP